MSDLSFKRTYFLSQRINTISSRPFDLGSNWRHTYKRVVGVSTVSPSVAYAYRPDGRAYGFYLSSPTTWTPDANIADRLTQLKDGAGNTIGWKYSVAADDSIETYDGNGYLQSITARNGQTQTLIYSDATTPAAIAPKPGLLITVTDQFGRQLNFRYDNQARIKKMIDPLGGEYLYAYDEASSYVSHLPGTGPINNNLTSITYPGGTKRIYWYNEQSKTANTDLPNALTGIADENGVRFATFTYDSSGRTVSTEHAGGVEKYSVTYNSPYGQSTVTDPSGTPHVHNMQIKFNLTKEIGETQPAGAGSAAASTAITYDVNANIASRTDFNNVKTCYAYDLTRNLETARVERLAANANCATALSAAMLVAPARKISTTWHPSLRLPMQIAEPKRLTSFTYDANGNVLTKTEQATTDLTGAVGLSAVATGTARTWAKTYNALGQVLTAKSPRTDIDDTTIYTYDTVTGNLLTVKNAAGHVTTYSNYDANGRVRKIVDANGLTTDLTYKPRGWLWTRTISGPSVSETTTYEYDNVGQVKTITLPDTSVVTYDYDDAHRLIKVTDSAGNSINYTLDNMGNRKIETVKDPNGTLAKTITRDYDALNRLKLVTGGAQ